MFSSVCAIVLLVVFLFVHFRTSVRLLGWSYLSVIVFVTSIHQVHTVGLQNKKIVDLVMNLFRMQMA